MLFVALGAPSALVVMVAFIVVASFGYFYRVRSSEQKGTDLREEMSLLHKHEGLGGEDTGTDD